MGAMKAGDRRVRLARGGRTSRRSPGELADLRARCEELEETLRAIRHGEVDALVVGGLAGDRVFTLEGADRPYRALVEAIDEGVGTLTPDGILLYANQRLAAIMGVPLERFIGAKLTDFLLAEDRARVERHLSNSGTPARFEIRLPKAGVLHLSLNQAAGSPLLFVVAMEVTQLVSANEALSAAKESLQQLSARIMQLQDDERRRIARDLHDVTGQHVAALLMTLGSAKRTPGAGSVRSALEDGIELAGQIGDQIRTLSYLLHPPLLDDLGLPAAIRWYAEGFWKRSDIRVEVAIAEPLPRLSVAAETALFRVLQEGLANVHRHSGSKSVKIRLALHEGEACLEIEDQGRGMASATRESRAARDSTRIANLGVGILGMRERMRELGGRLDVASTERGTRVVASLPMRPALARAASASRSPEAEGEAVALQRAQWDGRHVSVLIADDHEVVRDGVRQLIEGQPNWKVCGEAGDGLATIELSRKCQPDVVVLDLNMPVLSGREAISEIRKASPQAKILIFSALDSPEIERQVFADGAHGFVSKLGASRDLIAAIKGL